MNGNENYEVLRPDCQWKYYSWSLWKFKSSATVLEGQGNCDHKYMETGNVMS